MWPVAGPKLTPLATRATQISAGEPYTQGQLPFLQKGVLWAKKHGLSVIVDSKSNKSPPVLVLCRMS